MKGEFKYTKREGLPKGANEVKQHIEGQFSIHGYKADSPDVNNSFNIIPSGDITMKGVDFPVHGVDNLGNSQIMYPGNDYKFPGSSVFETPLRDSDDYEEAELTDEEIADLRAQGYVVEEYQNGGTTNKIPFEDWYKTVPEYKNDTTSYNLRRAYELAPQEELDAFVNTDAHLRSAYKQPNGIYEFVKRKDHPTVQNEIDWFNSAEATDFRKQYRLDDSGDYYRYIPIKQDGGVNPLEGDLFAKVLMERNRDKEFVKRAFNPEDYPDHVQHNEDGTTSTHRMAWGTDDTGQAYMFPTIFNEANEAIPVPNQYADYISSQGYKRATGMDKYQTGREVKYKGDDLYEARYMLPPVEITGTPSFAKDLPYYDYLKPEEKEWLRKNKNSDDAITRSIRAQAEEGYGIDGNPTYGQSAYEAALTPFREMGTIAAEETGIPAAYRIAQNPMNTLEGLANTALDLQALPITAIQAMLDYDNADLSINPLTGNPYGSGLVQTGDALTMLPAAGFLGAGLKKGAKYVKPAKAFNRTVEGASPAEIKQLRNSRGRIVGADNPQFERFYSSPDVRINSPFTERLPEGPFYEKLSPLVEDMINTKIARSLDPRGKKLIINQEKEYLKSIGVKPEHLDELAEKGYNARIEELETILDNKAWFHTPQHNAYRTGYTPANAYTDDNFWLKYTDKKPLKLDELYTIDDVRADPSLYNKINRLKRQQRKVHALVPLDNTLSFGNMFVDPRTIAHELAHVSQASRRLPIEKRLREAASPYGVRKGKLNLSKSLQEDYDYFADDFMRKGKPARGGIEPYAFAHETKQALLDKGIIKDWFEPITEETLFRARRHFDNRPSGIYDWNEQKFSSDSRMLDFTHPSRFGMLAKELNKIAPAVLPVAGAASLADYQTGGEKVYTDKEEYNKAMQMYSDSLNAAQAYNNIINLANSGKYPFTEGTVEGWSASDGSDPVVTDLKVWQKGKDFKESFKDFDNYNELEKDIDVLRNSPLTPSRIKIFENKGNIDDMPIFPNPFSDPSYGIQDALMFTLAEFEYPRTKPKYEELKPVEKKESPVVKVEKKEPVKKEEIKSDPLSKAKRVVDGYTQELKGYNIDGKFYTLEEAKALADYQEGGETEKKTTLKSSLPPRELYNPKREQVKPYQSTSEEDYQQRSKAYSDSLSLHKMSYDKLMSTGWSDKEIDAAKRKFDRAEDLRDRGRTTPSKRGLLVAQDISDASYREQYEAFLDENMRRGIKRTETFEEFKEMAEGVPGIKSTFAYYPPGMGASHSPNLYYTNPVQPILPYKDEAEAKAKAEVEAKKAQEAAELKVKQDTFSSIGGSVIPVVMAEDTNDLRGYKFRTKYGEKFVSIDDVDTLKQYSEMYGLDLPAKGKGGATSLSKYQVGGQTEEKPWEDEDIKTFLEQPNMVRSSPWLQGILKQKQEWEAANPPADTVETSPTPEVKITPDDSQLKSDDVGSYNNPDLYAQPEAPTSELDKAIINRDVKAYSDIVNPFAIDYSYTPKVEEPKEEIKAEEPQKVVKDTIQTDGTFDNFEIIQPTKPKTEVEITPEKETRVISETDEEFQFIPADIPGTYNIPDETYNSITQKYYDQNEKADAKMQELYYTITNPSVSQEEKDSAQKQFDELKELQKLNVAEINRVKKRQTGAFDVLLQEEGPAWLSKGLQKVGFADDYSLEAPPGEKLYEDYETKAKRDYEQELVTKSYESLNTPSEANQWYRWKYRVNASNDDPVTVQLYGNRGERDKKDPNIKGLGAMMHFLDQSPLTGSSHSSMKNFYNRLSDDQYIGYLQKGDGENYQLMYKKVGEIPKDELTSQNTFYLRTEDFDNINFDGKRVVDDNFAGHTYWTKKDDGEATIPISIGHNDNDYNYSSGNAVVYIFDHKGQRRYIHFAGSPNAIKKEGERIKKDYNLKDNSLTIGIADAGSYASAVKADKQGNINNKLLNSKDYGYWNLNSYTGAGMVLQDDFKSGGEYMEAELTPEEINWYLSQGYRVDELE
jgi:hypothetical protein